MGAFEEGGPPLEFLETSRMNPKKRVTPKVVTKGKPTVLSPLVQAKNKCLMGEPPKGRGEIRTSSYQGLTPPGKCLPSFVPWR